MNPNAYQQDFHGWIQHHIALLRQGRMAELDVDNLIEELESMSKRDRREIASHLVILLLHLLKWQYQPLQRSSSWRGSIVEQRYQVHAQLAESPSLKPYLADALVRAYPDAVKLACRETGLPESVFPPVCPYTLKHLLDDDFFPAPEAP